MVPVHSTSEAVISVSVALILFYQSTNTYALNALAGATFYQFIQGGGGNDRADPHQPI